MSSFNLPLRPALLALLLAAGPLLAGCTMTPVYNNAAAVHALALNFAAPTNPQEQIVYQDLARKFGTSSDPSAPQVTIRVTTASRALVSSATANPATGELMTASGVLKITRNGQPVLTTARQATATYSTDSQVLADNSAELNAQDQAAHALADTLELTIMAALAPVAPPSR